MTKLMRFKHLMAGAALLPFGVGATVVAGEADLRGPRLRTSQEIFDFGFVPQHAQVAHAFWLKNTGTETAVIERVKTNCGCTQAPLADSIVAAGDSTWIEIILGTGRMIGPVEKYTRVTANAIGRVPAFTIQAYVLTDTSHTPPITAEPAAVFIDPENPPAEGGSWWEYPVTLRNNNDQAVTVSAIAVPEEFIRLPATTFALAAGESRELVLQIAPAVMDQPYSKSVTFELGDATRTHLSLPFGRRPEY
jgi:hypothetical protein